MIRRPLLAALTVAATLAVAATTFPALAREHAEPTPGTAVQLSPDTLAAMRRDLSLSEDQARERVRKETWARNTVRSLRGGLADSYGGAWLTAGGGQLVVAVTDSGAARRVQATGAEPRMVRRSAADLDRIKTRLDAAGGESATIVGTYVDPSTNTVTVLVPPGRQKAAEALIAGAGVPSGTVRTLLKDLPKTLFDIEGGDPFTINRSARCSVGFAVEGGFVTAGHCGTEGDRTTGFNNAAQGTFVVSSFPRNDFAVVETNNRWTPTNVLDTDAGPVEVTGSDEALVGSSVCRTGSTSGTHCGVIEARNVTVNYPEGTVTGLTQTDVCAEPGDSGGPYFSGDQAQGVTSGGSGDCTVGGTTFFQPVNEILDRNNLTLVTS